MAIVAAPMVSFAAIVGGAVAGYLERGDLDEGARVGAFAGGIAAVPTVLGGFLFGGFLLGVAWLSHVAFTPIFVRFALILVPVYFLVAGAIGGSVGRYLRPEL